LGGGAFFVHSFLQLCTECIVKIIYHILCDSVKCFLGKRSKEKSFLKWKILDNETTGRPLGLPVI
jgi:hypothetical protein